LGQRLIENLAAIRNRLPDYQITQLPNPVISEGRACGGATIGRRQSVNGTIHHADRMG
jgi:hypothetical protein